MALNDFAGASHHHQLSCNAVYPVNTPTIRLPKALLKLLDSAPVLPTGTLLPSDCTTVANTGATDHMFPDKSDFISYHCITHLRVRMGNKTYALVLGHGTAIISLNGQNVLVRDALHVPGLCIPLYSLRAHHRQH